MNSGTTDRGAQSALGRMGASSSVLDTLGVRSLQLEGMREELGLSSITASAMSPLTGSSLASTALHNSPITHQPVTVSPMLLKAYTRPHHPPPQTLQWLFTMGKGKSIPNFSLASE